MNLAQRIIVILSFLVIFGMALFPPWKRLYDVYDDQTDKVVHLERAAGYHLVLRDQAPANEYSILRIDTTRLAVQLFAVIILTGLLYLAVRPSRPGTH